MPLLDIRPLSPATRMGLWRIAEEAPSPRQKERLAVQRLLLAMTGNSLLSIGHEPGGKPFVVEPSSTGGDASSPREVACSRFPGLSVSHTRGYAALLLSEAERVGIDIEWRSDRVERIAHRFIRPDEHAATTLEKLLVWSAKETLYKLFSEDNLLFFDMRTLAIEPQVLRMENMKRALAVNVGYEFTADYVLTYALLPSQSF